MVVLPLVLMNWSLRISLPSYSSWQGHKACVAIYDQVSGSNGIRAINHLLVIVQAFSRLAHNLRRSESAIRNAESVSEDKAVLTE